VKKKILHASVYVDPNEILSEMTSASGTDWALGLQKRSHAVLVEGDEAEGLYLESITHLGRTRQRLDLARVHLLYGEWLRRERRRMDAREQLRTAYRMFEAMGAAAFAERTARELNASGETARSRTAVSKNSNLTAQETQIARRARDGLSNPDISTRLFISTHTVSVPPEESLREAWHQLTPRTRKRHPPRPGDSGAGNAPTPRFLTYSSSGTLILETARKCLDQAVSISVPNFPWGVFSAMGPHDGIRRAIVHPPSGSPG
jgi:DNA-binding CsgD family transcriptional regulator